MAVFTKRSTRLPQFLDYFPSPRTLTSCQMSK